jgi:hypothetical protein
MVGQNCGKCGFRARYDRNPGSLLGRLWRWHAGWCPGWKKYMESLPEDEKILLSQKYKLDKFTRQ